MACYFLGTDPHAFGDEDDPEVWTGRWFERIGGGGDRTEVANQFTAEDLLAVTALSVQVPIETAALILGERAGDLGQRLAAIPNHGDIWTVERETIGENSPAWELCEELKNTAFPGIGWVIASKLLARKRPRLIPVYEHVIRAAMGAPKDWWRSLYDTLQDPALVRHLEQIRTEAGLSDQLSLLRVLDVAIWMAAR